MKILFINNFLGKDAIYREPLGIMYLTSAVDHKHDVHVVDPVRESIDKKIREIEPDVIAYSTRTGFHQYYIDLNKKLKKKYKFISVFGGPHATFFPDIINQEGVDYVCRGEAEDAFLEFLDALEEKKDTYKIKNFWIKEGKKVYKNECRPLVQDLDAIRFPKRSLLDSYEEIRNAKAKSFITSRGCPFNCSYCFNESFKDLYKKDKNYVRKRTVKNVIDEIRKVKENYNFELVIFEDDTFNINKRWLKEFSKEFKKLGLKFICVGIRADLFDEETAMMLKDSNCVGAIIGLESGSEKIRKEILCKNVSDKQLINCARLLNKAGIPFITENILAIPASSLDDDLKTLELNQICKPNYSNVRLMQPYPSTRIYQIAIEQGVYEKNSFDSLGSFFEKSSLNIDHKLERENLQKLFALAVRYPLVYSNIKWLIKLRLTFFYSWVFKVYKAYYGSKWLPHKKSIGEYMILVKRYFNL